MSVSTVKARWYVSTAVTTHHLLWSRLLEVCHAVHFNPTEIQSTQFSLWFFSQATKEVYWSFGDKLERSMIQQCSVWNLYSVRPLDFRET